MNIKKVITTVAIGLSLCASAGLQKEMLVKEAVSNNVPILIDVEFSEDDPIFTNWVGSAEFYTIPRMSSKNYDTEYEPGKTNKGYRTTFWVGSFSEAGSVKKDVKILDLYSIKDKAIIEMPGSTSETYQCTYIDNALTNKANKVDLTSITPLSPSATTEEIVTAVKALANALGNK